MVGDYYDFVKSTTNFIDEDLLQYLFCNINIDFIKRKIMTNINIDKIIIKDLIDLMIIEYKLYNEARGINPVIEKEPDYLLCVLASFNKKIINKFINNTLLNIKMYNSYIYDKYNLPTNKIPNPINTKENSTLELRI